MRKQIKINKDHFFKLIEKEVKRGLEEKGVTFEKMEWTAEGLTVWVQDSTSVSGR